MTKRPELTDQLVSASDVRLAMKRMSGTAWQVQLRELERIEPALAAFMSTAGDTARMALDHVGYPKEAINETVQYFLHALILVHTITSEGHRKLLDDILPFENGAVRQTPPSGERQ